MGSLRALQGRRQSRRVQKQVDETLLILDRQADDLGFIDCPVRHLLSRRDYKIADTAALKFRGALDDAERIGRNPSFDPRGASCFVEHGSILLAILICTGFCRTTQTGSEVVKWSRVLINRFRESVHLRC